MLVQRTATETVVKFSASEVVAAGGPNKGAYVSYDAKGRLEDFSHYLEKASKYDPILDILVAQADAALATIH